VMPLERQAGAAHDFRCPVLQALLHFPITCQQFTRNRGLESLSVYRCF
jgi:hypothetical protein